MQALFWKENIRRTTDFFAAPSVVRQLGLKVKDDLWNDIGYLPTAGI